MTVLNTNETMTPEKILMVEELGRKVFNHPASQIWRIVENGLSPKETFIKTWIKLLKHFRVLLKREGYSGRVSFEVVFSDIHSEICILIKEDKNIGMISANRLPSVLFWKLVTKAGKRLREINKNDMHIYTDDVEMFENIQVRKDTGLMDDFVDIRGGTNPQSIFFENKWYMLIDGIAEQVGLSSETLRNWEKGGDIKFEHLNYKSRVKKIPFLRGVLIDNVQDFIKRVRELKNPPVGFLNTKDTLKKLGIHHSTLKRWRESGKIPFRKWKNEYFYQA